jgi:hypothetical protein
MVRSDLTLDVLPLRRFQKLVSSGCLYGTGVVGQVFDAWGTIYRSAMRRRFVRLSRGGGEWPALKPSTIARRRHGKGGRYKRGRAALRRARRTGGGKVAILRDTGTLLGALVPQFLNAPGQYERKFPYGVEVGFGGPAYHPKGMGLTIGELAGYHHRGDGNLPERPLVVDPDRSTMKQMVLAMEMGVDLARRQAER